MLNQRINYSFEIVSPPVFGLEFQAADRGSLPLLQVGREEMKMVVVARRGGGIDTPIHRKGEDRGINAGTMLAEKMDYSGGTADNRRGCAVLILMMNDDLIDQ